MKENISIIFAAIIGTFLIVILPLYSLLDRQDSMSYNVVLTETTNFVDNIRNNGFIDRQSYLDYIAAISSTSNTYKVSIEAYKNTLIHDTDENGKIISDSYIEEKQLYNTQDILEVLESEKTTENLDDSNIKNNAYLLNENDEVYVRVYNTNITSGSIMYNMLSGTTNTKVINISYGGVVNKVNWELYNKIQAEVSLMPEVIMSVPVNANNNTNIQLIDENGSSEYIDCTLENLEDYIGSTSIEELCTDLEGTDKQEYVYLYDLSNIENKTIRVAVELRRFDKIDIGSNTNGSVDTYVNLSELDTSLFDNRNGVKSSVELYIISNYIRLNGMYADIDLKLRQKGDYYVFDIVLTDVEMSSLDYISTVASITILPGLGEDKNGVASLMAETVEIELFDENAVNTVTISSPHIWNKLLKTKSLIESRILDNVVYANEEIAFMISYTGINGKTSEEILEAIKQNLRIYESYTSRSNLEFYTEEQFYERFGIDIATRRAGHIIVKFSYNSANESKDNYIKLLDGWIETEIQSQVYAIGAQSKHYRLLLDNAGPLEPTIALEGTKGNNGWYLSNVSLKLIPTTSDTIIRNNNVEVGGSGVYKNTLTLTGAIKEQEQEATSVNITEEGITYAISKAYDYVGNITETQPVEIKIDKTAPTAPAIVVSGTEGTNGWYKSNVTLKITPGTDNANGKNNGSGIEKTTYRIEGANQLDETEGLTYTLTKQGKSKIIVTTYDNAGNKSETSVNINIDTTTPPEASIKVVDGEKNSASLDNDWYVTNVTLRITVDSGEAVSGFANASYKVTGDVQIPLTDFTDNTQDVTITQNGTHNITVYTYTQAGNVRVTTYQVKIDKNAPNAPTVEILKGTTGENNWYTSNVELSIKSNGDVGTSTEDMITYTITNNGVTTIEKEINDSSRLFFNEEGKYILTVYSRDKALNKVEVQREINIDKTAPTPAEFVITGTKGIDNWYISDVQFAHKGANDAVSGINTVTLSTDRITQNTEGTKVILTTKDYAGHTVTKDVTIKMDKSVPTDPTIQILEQPTGTSAFGTLAYNKDVNVTITPGVDYFLPNKSNQDRTTYTVTTKNGTNVIIPETEGTNFTITEEGIITVTARTYDKAGNIAVATKLIWINKLKPASPKLLSINGESVENYTIKEVTSTSNKMSLQVGNLTEGNDVKIVLVNQSTYEITEIIKTATSSDIIEVELKTKGTYSITLTQTNMFGTESDESTGLYYYKYE